MLFIAIRHFGSGNFVFKVGFQLEINP